MNFVEIREHYVNKKANLLKYVDYSNYCNEYEENERKYDNNSLLNQKYKHLHLDELNKILHEEFADVKDYGWIREKDSKSFEKRYIQYLIIEKTELLPPFEKEDLDNLLNEVQIKIPQDLYDYLTHVSREFVIMNKFPTKFENMIRKFIFTKPITYRHEDLKRDYNNNMHRYDCYEANPDVDKIYDIPDNISFLKYYYFERYGLYLGDNEILDLKETTDGPAPLYMYLGEDESYFGTIWKNHYDGLSSGSDYELECNSFHKLIKIKMFREKHHMQETTDNITSYLDSDMEEEEYIIK